LSELKVPTSKAVRDLFSDLIGREVGVTPGEPVVLGVDVLGCVAVYVTDQIQMAAVLVLDLALTAYLGGSLGLLPVGGVQDLLAEGTVSNSALDNVREVLNVAAALFNVSGAPHVKFYSLVVPSELPPVDVTSVMHSFGGRLDLVVEVPGYGSGALSIVLV